MKSVLHGLTQGAFCDSIRADKGFDGEKVEARMPERELPGGERRGAKRFEYISRAARRRSQMVIA